MKKKMCVFVLIAVAIGMFSIAMPADIPEQSIDEATEQALEEGKLLLIGFSAAWCNPCKLFNKAYEEDPKFRDELSKIVVFRKIEATDPKNKDIVIKYNIHGYPTWILITPQTMEIHERFRGFSDKSSFIGTVTIALNMDSIKECELKPQKGMQDLLRLAMYYSEDDCDKASEYYYPLGRLSLFEATYSKVRGLFYKSQKDPKSFILNNKQELDDVTISLAKALKDVAEIVEKEHVWFTCFTLVYVHNSLGHKLPKSILTYMRSMILEAEQTGELQFAQRMHKDLKMIQKKKK